MHRALSLLALGITLALTAAQPMLTLTSIKAVDSTSNNQDKWSMKGFLNDPDADLISTIADEGLSADLVNSDDLLVSDVTFAAAACRDLSNGRGVLCKDAGARISFKRTKRVPHEAKVKAMKNHNKTDSASSYYSVSGVFRRQQFENTISNSANLSGSLGNNQAFTDEPTLSNCRKKGGARTTKLFCQ